MKNILVISILLIIFGALYPNNTIAYGECSEYGVMVTYDSYSNTCECMSGYVMSSKYGFTQCVSGDSICSDKYGYNSRYDSFSNSCECSYGYILGKDSIGRTQCVSPDSICTDSYGYNSRYNSLSDSCECSYGYVISGGQCTYGNSVCRSKHGTYSSYNSLSKSCECDSGYTLDDYGQCVEKQNNVYFKLLDVNTDEKQAIIKSEYDSVKYLVTYGSGCYSSAMNRNNGRSIVVNLGTDFSLDTWDKIVLPDDNEVCDIRSKERTYHDSFEEMLEEEDTYSPTYYIPSVQPQKVTTPSPAIITPKKEFSFIEMPITPSKKAILKEQSNIRKCPSVECQIIGSGEKSNNINIVASFKDWYKISKINNKDSDGWINSSLVTIDSVARVATTTQKITKPSAIKKVGSWFKGLFR